MRPENELLRLCSAGIPPDERSLRLRALAQKPLDWAYFREQAVFHRVFPQAYRALTATAVDGFEPETREGLRSLYISNLARNLAIEKELTRILGAMSRVGVTAVTYKGPLLAETAYGDLGLRQFNDLDILIRESDLEAAVSALASLGYGSGLQDSPALQKRLRACLRALAFTRPNGPCAVEVQWRLAQRYHPLFRRPGRIWARLREESLAGFPVHTLSLEDTLLVLCLHGLYHSWERLQMVSDVARSMPAGRVVDWDGLLADAREQGALRILLLGVLLAHRVLESPLPPQVLRAADGDRFVRGLAARISAGFFDRSSYLKKARAFFFLEARMIDGLGNRLGYVWGRLSTPNENDLDAFRPPARLSILRPFRRMVRLFKTYFLSS
jgi:hypothetical protein